MRLIYHLGFHKTGTSALQSFGRNHGDLLLEHGVLYPHFGLVTPMPRPIADAEAGQRHLGAVLRRPGSLAARYVIDKYHDLAVQAGAHTVLISDEIISRPDRALRPAAVKALQDRFDEVKFIIYLRRQDDWADSFYREYLTWPAIQDTWDFDGFLREFLSDWMDYPARLAAWAAAAGRQNLIVRSFDDRAYPDLVQDILHEIGLDALADSLPARKSVNSSWPRSMLDMILRVNGLRYGQKEKSDFTQHVFQLIDSQGTNLATPCLQSDWFDARLARFQADNRAIARDYALPRSERFVAPFAPLKGRPDLSERALDASTREEVWTRFRTTPLRPATVRPNGGTWGISCLCNERLAQTGAFVDYHLALGASRIILFLDNPGDPIQRHLDDPRVIFVPCPPEFWVTALGRPPSHADEKLAVAHKIGVERLRGEFGLDWALNVDADELLWVQPGLSIDQVLRRSSARFNQVVIRPLEAVFVEEADSELFAARSFKVPPLPAHVESPPKALARSVAHRWRTGKARLTFGYRRFNRRRDSLYEQAMPMLAISMRHGFLGHELGRVVTARGVQIDHVDSHAFHSASERLKQQVANLDIWLLHFDASSYESWHLKLKRRIEHPIPTLRIMPKRKIQQDRFAEAMRDGTTRDLFRELYFLPGTYLGAMKRAGLIVNLDLPGLSAITAKWLALEKTGD